MLEASNLQLRRRTRLNNQHAAWISQTHATEGLNLTKETLPKQPKRERGSIWGPIIQLQAQYAIHGAESLRVFRQLSRGTEA